MDESASTSASSNTSASHNSLGTPPIIVDRSWRGVVSSFDEPAGWGVIVAESGQEIPFHCTAIADGTRDIAVGTSVRFDLGAGRMGRWEGVGVEPA